MADQPGEHDLRAEDVDAIVKNYALESFTMLQVCTVVKTSSATNTYYEETDSDILKTATTGVTETSFKNAPSGAVFPHVEHSWTEINEHASMHGADHTMGWDVWKLSAIDVKARMLERVGRAIANSVDTAIYTELATTTNTAAAVQTWDNATESLQQPLKDILIARSALKINNWSTTTNLKMVIHPTNFMELLNNPVIRNAGQFYTDGVTRNGSVGKIADFDVIETNVATENQVLFCIAKTAMTWYEAQPLATYVKEDPGQTLKIRAYQMGVPVLINNNAAYKLTAC